MNFHGNGSAARNSSSARAARDGSGSALRIAGR